MQQGDKGQDMSCVPLCSWARKLNHFCWPPLSSCSTPPPGLPISAQLIQDAWVTQRETTVHDWNWLRITAAEDCFPIVRLGLPLSLSLTASCLFSVLSCWLSRLYRSHDLIRFCIAVFVTGSCCQNHFKWTCKCSVLWDAILMHTYLHSLQ